MLIAVDDYELDDDHWAYDFIYEVLMRINVPEDVFILFDVDSGYFEETGALGWITEIDDDTFYIKLDGKMDFVNTLQTIAHEMRHMEQMFNKVWDYRSDFEPILWKGNVWDKDSKDEPWETDAEDFAINICLDLVQKYVRQLQKINPNFVEWIPS